MFEGDVDFEIMTNTRSPASNQAVVIALGVLLALSVLGLIVAVALIIRWDWEPVTSDSHIRFLRI